MTKATFFHAGCPVCVSAEQQLASALDSDRYDVEIVHLGERPEQIDLAEGLGVESVPALVIDRQVFHINHGADVSDLRAA